MKTQLFAFAAIVVLAVGADLILDQIGFSSSERSASDSVRLSSAQN